MTSEELIERMRRLPDPIQRPLRMAWRLVNRHDPRRLLSDLDSEKKRQEFLESDAYEEFIKLEESHWQILDVIKSPAVPTDASSTTFNFALEHPRVRQEMHFRATGNEIDIWDYMKMKIPPAENALVLGAGNGDHCRLLIQEKIAQAVTAYDICSDTIDFFQKIFNRNKLPVSYMKADLNLHDFAGESYDLCIAMHSLHHLISLERLFNGLAGALHGNGCLICEEYTGPRFVEFSTPIKKHALTLFKALPQSLKRDRGGRLMKTLYFCDRWLVQRQSPFEAIRSDCILSALQRSFHIDELRTQGGGLILALLSPLIHNFHPNDGIANEWIDRIMDEDRKLTQRGKIPNCYSFFIAHPRLELT